MMARALASRVLKFDLPTLLTQHLNPNSKISLQRHKHRAEHWVVVAGTATVTRGDDIIQLKQNESAYIPIGMAHRLENKTGKTRVSMDFRVMPYDKYDESTAKSSATASRKFVLGDYYKLYEWQNVSPG